MEVHLILGQRKERYPGEHAPEVLDAIDDCTHQDNNGEWLETKLLAHRSDTEMENVQVITIEIPNGPIRQILRPQDKPIEAKIIQPET